ncbi:MAG: flippase-like domain-containing protein [Gammaproteobacteria bacterium]|nr:flippase-like domain-containing protein [Gammaproteobacteria bacterium]
MKHLSVAGMILGLMLFALLLIWQGLWEIIQLLIKSGWALLWLPLVWLPILVPASESWRLLFDKSHKPPFLTALTALWMGRAVNNLLPVATIGGEIIKARLLILWGIQAADGCASVLVDKTVQVIALIIWGLIGITLLIVVSQDDSLAYSALAGFMLLVLGVIGFFLVQRAGLFNLLATLGKKLIHPDDWEGVAINARVFDQTVNNLYRDKANFFHSCALKTVSLILQTFEVWLACYLLGYPVTLMEAVLLKSLTATLTDVAFMIPNGYGIQEGAFIVVGAMLGMTPDVALAVSLAIRIRELIIDLPGLLYWQFLEGRLWLKKRASG